MRRITAIGLACAALLLAACDQQRVRELESTALATEADVRAKFGEPALVLEKADGTKILEYPRQPEGVTNYLAVIGADGKLTALTQQLTPDNFAQVHNGMSRDSVRRLLGKVAQAQRFELKPDEEHWAWRFEEPGGLRKLFTVTFDAEGKVKGKAITDDPRETRTSGQ